MSARPSRRAVVAGAIGLATASLTGCSGENQNGSPTGRAGSAEPPNDRLSAADLALVNAVVAAEQRLVTRCQRTVRRHPDLRSSLGPVLEDHQAHLRALGADRRLGDESNTPLARPRSSAFDRARTRRALALVVAAEQSAAAERVADCLAAASGPLARLLASIGACEAQHVSVLAEP